MRTATAAADQRLAGLDAHEAARTTWNIIKGEDSESTPFEREQLHGLLSELHPFSETFRLSVIRTRMRNRPPHVSVNIYATDPGCVNNNGRPLATAWLEDFRAEGGTAFFYYEA